VNRLLVDTSAWYAFVDRRDPLHDPVTTTLRAHRDRLLASDYILDEAVTLVRYRLGWSLAHQLGAGLRSGRLARLERLLPTDLDAAWALFERRPDQRLSFTDCTSFVLMQRLKLAAAVTLDRDFRALGLATLP
jgi:uncharacterized protein